MEHSPYGLSVTLPVPFDTAVADATAALKAEGFGVLTTIDVQHTLKTKLNREFRKYLILGACNPSLADRALQAELEIGLLLPCNVIVYEADTGQSVVAAMAPLTALGVVGANPPLREVAREADERLRRALAALESATSRPYWEVRPTALIARYVAYPPDRFRDRYPCCIRKRVAKYARWPTPQQVQISRSVGSSP